jgi:succinate dehydrogenase/fumarate reductase-like Fe-S protein
MEGAKRALRGLTAASEVTVAPMNHYPVKDHALIKDLLVDPSISQEKAFSLEDINQFRRNLVKVRWYLDGIQADRH